MTQKMDPKKKTHSKKLTRKKQKKRISLDKQLRRLPPGDPRHGRDAHRGLRGQARGPPRPRGRRPQLRDARAYGIPQEDRLRIKTATVYRHHCVSRLPPRPARLRRVAFTALVSPHALLWALELCGFRDVGLKVHAHQATVDAGEAADGGWGEGEGGCCFEEEEGGIASGRDCLGRSHGQRHGRQEQAAAAAGGRSSLCRGWCAGGARCTCGGAGAATAADASSPSSFLASSPAAAPALVSAPSFEFDALPAAETLTAEGGNAGSHRRRRRGRRGGHRAVAEAAGGGG